MVGLQNTISEREGLFPGSRIRRDVLQTQLPALMCNYQTSIDESRYLSLDNAKLRLSTACLPQRYLLTPASDSLWR